MGWFMGFIMGLIIVACVYDLIEKYLDLKYDKKEE